MLSFAGFMLLSMMGIVAFVPLSPIAIRHTTSLNGVLGNDENLSRNKTNINDGSGIGNSSLDVESARQRLENMLSNPKDETEANDRSDEGDSNNENEIAKTPPSFSFSKLLSNYEDGMDFSSSSFPTPPPLSSIERDRRLFEIRLLECLVEGDDALSELWNHWYSERGSTVKSRLEQIGGMFTDPRDWEECERDLIELVDEYGIYFVEPVNLLATLYFLQGKLELSYKLCQIILTLKPYHVGALSGVVQVTLGLNDPIASRKWALKLLPRALSGPGTVKDSAFDEQNEGVKQLENPQRIEWIERAVVTAKELLDQAEQRTQEDFFGKPEAYYGTDNDNGADNDVLSSSNIFDDDDDSSAWQ